MTYIKIKPGVNMSGLSPRIWDIAGRIADIFGEFDLDCVITSAFRPQRPRSLHHGFALDFRANHIKQDGVPEKILNRMRTACGKDYDVILHGKGRTIHFHIEYDPE